MLIIPLGNDSKALALEKRWTQIVPNIVSPSELPDKVGAKTRITFATASDSGYDDIDITDGELTYTTIKAEHVIPNIIGPSFPRYKHKDLLTRRLMLSGKEWNPIIQSAQEKNFRSLPDYVGPGHNDRQYIYRITVLTNGAKQTITYGSNPTGPRMPDSFKQMMELVLATARRSTDWHEPKSAPPIRPDWALIEAERETKNVRNLINRPVR
jgi:hypothetical protein